MPQSSHLHFKTFPKSGEEKPTSALKPAKLSKALQNILQEKDKVIDDLKALVETISRGKYMWESTFDAIMDPVMMVSADYIIQRANMAAAQSAGMDVREMIGKKCYESLAGFKSPCRGCPLQATLKIQASHSLDLAPFLKNGRQYHANAYPMAQELKEQAVVHYRDITEERRLHDKLLHSEKMAAIGTLAGGVAHEINNPLGGILAFTQLILKDIGTDHQNYADLKEIEEATLRCKRIVQNLLDFSRQNREETMESLQLNEVILKVIPLIQIQTRTSRVELKHHLDQTLPLIRGNFYKLQQIFLNLITNAYHAMPQGGHLMLKTFPAPDHKSVVAQVSDTGAGIPRQNLDKIFDPYFTTKGQSEGTGLGLSITYGIIQEHQGSIEVKSEEGKGSTFILTFPAEKMS